MLLLRDLELLVVKDCLAKETLSHRRHWYFYQYTRACGLLTILTILSNRI